METSQIDRYELHKASFTTVYYTVHDGIVSPDDVLHVVYIKIKEMFMTTHSMQENEYVVEVNVRERRKIDKFNCCFFRSMEIHIPHFSILVFILVLISHTYVSNVIFGQYTFN